VRSAKKRPFQPVVDLRIVPPAADKWVEDRMNAEAQRYAERNYLGLYRGTGGDHLPSHFASVAYVVPIPVLWAR